MLGSILGSIIGNIAASGDQDQSEQLRKQALATLQGTDVPSVESQKIALEKLVSQGQLTPEMLETIQQQDSELNNVSADPRLKDQQMKALSSLVQQSQTGLNASDEAALNKIRGGVERDAQGRSQAILQNMQQRGMGGSGAELSAQLMNSQAATQRASDEGLNVAAQANQRALDALAKSGDLSTNLRSQDYSEKSSAAKAQDAINQFNAANRQNVAGANVGSKNSAQATNLAAKQNLANQNVGLANQQQTYNKGLIQQNFQNNLAKNSGVSGAQLANSGLYAKDAAATRAEGAQIGAGVDQAIGSAASFLSDKNAKQDIKDGNYAIENFMDKLTAKSYKYKNPEHGDGKQLGVLAQDVAKSPEGKKVVTETKEGKAIDVNKAVSTLLAANANLHQRLKKLEEN